MLNVDKTPLRALKTAVYQLPYLLENKSRWDSYYIDAEEPVVERIWHVFDFPGDPTQSWRVCLHRIQPANQAFYHPHRHPSAILVCKGSYEMGVGVGPADGMVPPPIFGPMILRQWDCYQMSRPHDWHYIKTLEAPSFSIMVTGEPYEKNRKIARPRPRPLSPDEHDRIRNFFDENMLRMAQLAVEHIDEDTKVNLGAN